MDQLSNAEKLHITDGFVIWVMGRSIEETGLLDPLPEGAEVVEERGEDEHDSVDAAILFVDDRAQLISDLDDLLPQVGSIPVVWICFPPSSRSDVDTDTVSELVADYGWLPVETKSLDETWEAVRVLQD